jgi:hypothetical protein
LNPRANKRKKPRDISAAAITYINLTMKLCGVNEAQRSLRPNERLVMCDFQYVFSTALW